jgi:C4-dicarboxylate-specific signal transduction histidine kinase
MDAGAAKIKVWGGAAGGTLQQDLVNETVREMVLLPHCEATQFAVSVRMELAADLPQVMGDRVQLQQVLMNLMMNSIDAMKDVDGKHVPTVQSKRGEEDHVLISVSDTGVGLPPQQAANIFDEFFTTKPYGTGMALRISRSIVAAHGGQVVGRRQPAARRKSFFHTANQPQDRRQMCWEIALESLTQRGSGRAYQDAKPGSAW